MRRLLTALLAPFALVAIVPAVVTLNPAEPTMAGGGCHQEQMTDAAGVAVDMSENCFSPTVIRIGAGESVRWTNQDPDAHSVTGVANSWGTYDSLLAGASAEYRFDSSGVYPYFCIIHPSMVGAVVVGDGTRAAAAVTGGGGEVVSVAVPGDAPASVETAPAESESGDDGVSPWLVAGIVLAVGVVGAGAGLAIGRRSRGVAP